MSTEKRSDAHEFRTFFFFLIIKFDPPLTQLLRIKKKGPAGTSRLEKKLSKSIFSESKYLHQFR